MSPRRKPVEGSEDEAPPSVSPATAAALSGLPVSLVRAATNGAPEVRLRLERLGPKTRALETNTARAPIFAAPSREGVQLALSWEELPVHGGSFVIREARGPLSPREEHLLGALHTAYIRDGLPEHRRVTLSLGEAARLLGHSGQPGGRNREIVKEALRRIAAVSLESTVRYRDEHGRPQEDTLGYRLVDSWHTTTRGGGRGSVVLSEPIAALLSAGSVTFLRGPVWEALLARDLIAARVWTYLEADDLTHARPYALWAAPPGEPARERSMPALTDLLRLRDGNRARVAARLRAACAVIAEEDDRYTLEVVKSREPGMWHLRAGRGRGTRGRGRVGTSAYRERDPDVSGVGTLTYIGRDPDVRGRAGNRGVSSSLSSSSIVVEDVQDKTGDGARPRPLAELIGALDLGPRPDPSPAPEVVQSVPPEVAERRRARARAILETAATEAEREAARRYLEDE